MHLTTAQLLILQSHSPETLRPDGTYDGDDNDLACAIANIARKVRSTGAVRKAFDIDSAAPTGFFNCTWEEYEANFGEGARRHYLNHMMNVQALAETRASSPDIASIRWQQMQPRIMSDSGLTDAEKRQLIERAETILGIGELNLQPLPSPAASDRAKRH